MKFLQIFNKTPNYRKFNFNPRFYNAEEEERQQRISRVEHEVKATMAKEQGDQLSAPDPTAHRSRIKGAFRQANQNSGPSGTTASPLLLRFAILLTLVLGFMGYLEYGPKVFYAMGVGILALYGFFKFRRLKSNGR
jgi:hypothetical protein